MRPIRSISVLIPTWQGIEFLERVLTALSQQDCGLAWDLWVVDSGSTDGTLELLEAWRERLGVALHVVRIHQVEFDHGDTRNLLVARSAGDLCVFLTQDAIPAESSWLQTLWTNFEDPSVGAAYCRNVPRPDAHPLTRLFNAGDPGYAEERRIVSLPPEAEYQAMGPDERRLLYNFNDVASAIRRELWERHPFPRTWFGEDVLMARALLEAGYSIVYDEEATVEHSHDYDRHETYARARVDGRFNAEWLGRVCLASQHDVGVLTERICAQDAAELRASDLPVRERDRLEGASRTLRGACFQGLFDGGQTTLRRPATRLLKETSLSVLFVVHGFPPDTWAGTEIYTLNLARELQSRGHRVAVFARSPARSSDEQEYSIVEDRFEGLRVLRFIHSLEHARLSESYSKRAAETAFRGALESEAPHVVHFQHLIHTSVGLVDAAHQAGLPTVLTCHDYWALCSRVQLIRPDGTRCEGNMGSGCYLCVKETRMNLAPWARRLDAVGGGLLKATARKLARSSVVSDETRRKARDYGDLKQREELVPAAYAACDLIISPSRYLREVYLRSGHFEAERFVFSDNGMRTDHVEALEKPPEPAGRVRFGFVGSLVWYKGGEVMMRAMNRLAGLGCTLHVHGDFDPDQDEHHAALEELAQGAAVEFHGRFDNSRLSEVYAQIDVLVVPSLWVENSPITIHEAFLTRTPILASDIGGMAEFVEDGVNGLQFRVGDDEDLAAKMKRFLDDPGLIAQLSRNFPPVKTIAENAAEMEFRYRALCCRQRTGESRLLSLDGRDARICHGPAELQGESMLLLRPGGSAVEFDLGPGARGMTELRLTIIALAGEPDVQHGGRVFLNGHEVGRVELFRARGADEEREVAMTLELQPGSNRLRLETALEPGGHEAHLRIGRLTVESLSTVEQRL